MIRLDLTVAELCDILEAPLVGGNAKLRKRKVKLCLDSREASEGVVFWPLVGEKFDAHKFVPSVMERGALMSVVNENILQTMPVQVHVPVENTSEALLKLAKGYQRRFALKKIAITGSNGKTTTKDMVSSILARKFETLSTNGNFNNQVGVPLTVFRFMKKHQVAVVEMGTNAPGEIKPLSMCVEPHIAIITNVGHSHLEGLGTVENVYKEKVSITQGLLHNGTLVVNADDPYLSRLRSTLRYKVIPFGIHRGQIKPQDLTWDENACARFRIGRTQFHLSVPGIHNLYNALAAITVATLLNVPKSDMVDALANFRASKMRMEIHKCRGFQVAADCYNANPSSMKMSLETIGTIGSANRRIAVLGDMLELGTQSAELHVEIGNKVQELGFDLLCTVGNESKMIFQGAHQAGMDASQNLHFESRSELMSFLSGVVQPGDMVLVKGSRGMKLEEVVEGLRALEPVLKKSE